MTTFFTLHVLLPLAQKPPNPKDVKQGWLGFAVFLALAAAVVLLWLSFRRQLKKVDFVEEPDPPGTRPRKRPTARVTIPLADDAVETRPARDAAAGRPDERPDRT